MSKAINLNKLLLNIFIPFAFFVLLTGFFYPRLFTNFSTSVEKNDGRLLAWTVAWDNHKILTDPLNIFEANIFYPNENTLTYSEHFIAGSILALPVYILSNGNPAGSFNFLMILSFVLNSFFTYLLVKYLTKNRLAGLIGGVIFGFCSYKVYNYVHLQNMVVFYFPLLVLFFYKFLENKSKKYLVGILFCLILQSLTSWYHMVFICLLLALLIVYSFCNKKLDLKDISKFILIGIIFIISIIPFALPYFEFQKENASSYNIQDLKTFSADFGGYLFPPPNTYIGSEVLPKVGISKQSWLENFNFIGYVVLLLSFLAIFKIKINKDKSLNISIERKAIIFTMIGLIFTLLSFGPFLRIDDVTTRIPLPYLFIYHFLPPLRFIRAVSRFSTVVFLMTAILSGFGSLKIFNYLNNKFNFKHNALTMLTFSILLCVIIFEFYPFQRHWTDRPADVSSVPAVYKEIKNNDEVKAIVELPLNVDPFTTTKYIYYAGIHLKPIVNGYSGFEPGNYSFYKSFDNLTNKIALARLYSIGVTHILINPEFKEEVDTTFLKEIYSDEGYTLYEIKKEILNEKLYFDNFSDLKIKQNIDIIKYKFFNTKKLSSDEESFIIPKTINKESEFEISSSNVIKSLYLGFRAYTNKDYIEIDCGENLKYKFTNSTEYFHEGINMKCNTYKIKIKLYSDLYKDRSLISSIGLTF